MNIKELAEQAHEFAAWACEVDLRANYSTVREERFAELVAAAERESCAKLCESEGARIDASWESCAAAIRARGDK